MSGTRRESGGLLRAKGPYEELEQRNKENL